MNKPLTIKQLYNECKAQMLRGNGDKVIMISSDDEGNNYHYLWYSFCEDVKGCIEYSCAEINKDIAEEKDTIILG
jgi:hypothetical protein